MYVMDNPSLQSLTALNIPVMTHGIEKTKLGRGLAEMMK